MKITAVSKTFVMGLVALMSLQAQSADFEWSGIYRIEGNHIKNSELDSRGRQLDYGLHHLSLRPKIVASDGITIYGQFELFTNSAYPNSQLGQELGSGVNNDGTPNVSTSADNSNALSGNQASEALLISQLYLTWTNEYGALIAGRAPLHFGLGMSYNAGRGLFDHWFDNRDLVGYKVMMGNLYILPMYGKVAENDRARAEDINDYMVQLQYENPETDLEMGVFYRVRKSGDDGSDVPVGTDLIGGTGAITAAVNMNELNVFALKDTDRYRIGVEGAFLSGQMGAKTSSLDDVSMNGFGIAAEFEYRPEESLWKLGLKVGHASGDDPDSDNAFEGYVFDRNYDVAMLLFNRPLGRRDVLRTGVYGGGPVSGQINRPDVESISNVLYVAPYSRYRWSDKMSLDIGLATGWVNTDPVKSTAGADVGKDLGYEVDLGLSYSPRKGITWMNEFGMLFPGSAFDFNNDGPSFAYGYTSRAAISF